MAEKILYFVKAQTSLNKGLQFIFNPVGADDTRPKDQDQSMSSGALLRNMRGRNSPQQTDEYKKAHKKLSSSDLF